MQCTMHFYHSLIILPFENGNDAVFYKSEQQESIMESGLNIITPM